MCRRLKANPATAAIPIVFLSAADDLSERLIGLRDGGVDYILKPFESEEVIARIRIHLGLKAREPLDDAWLSVEHLNEEEVLVRAAQGQLLANLSQTPRLEELAEQLGVSEKRLSRAFRRCLDMTVFQYLRNERMRTAQRLLTQTSLSMVAISEEVGFTSAANFSTAFREHTGVSPSDYRRGDAPDGGASSLHDT